MLREYQLGRKSASYSQKLASTRNQGFRDENMLKYAPVDHNATKYGKFHRDQTNHITNYRKEIQMGTQKQIGWENQLRRKLNKLKQQFQGVPNWEGYAHNILFENNNRNERQRQNYGHEYPQKISQTDVCKTPENIYTKTVPQKYPKDNSNKESFLGDSNISFQIKETSSVEESLSKDHKYSNYAKYSQYEDPTIKQFQLYSAKKYSNSRVPLKNKDSKVDERIQMIQRKIRECEEKKRKLKLNQVQRSITPKNSKLDQSVFSRRQRSFTKLPAYEKHQDYSKDKFKQYIRTTSQDNLQKISRSQKLSKPPKYPPQNHSSKKPDYEYEQDVSPKFAGIEDKKFFHAEKIHKAMKDSQNSNFGDKCSNSNIKKQEIIRQKKSMNQYGDQAMRGIENRKKIRNQYQIPMVQKKQTKKLVNKLSQQAKLDEQFKNHKLWLKSVRNQNKWEILQGLLAKQDIRLSVEETQKLLKLSEQEDNPFFSVNSFNSDFNSVINSFIKSEDFWTENIEHQFDPQKLKEEGFQKYSMDLDKKSVIVLEDLVRFLNMETGTFFRNRDLITIFKRISTQNQITYEEFLKTIC